MKSSLIIKLIEAHCSGQESLFDLSLEELARDEEKKGNIALAASIRDAYKPGTGTKNTKPVNNGTSVSSFFVTQGSVSNVAPRDRDSMLELYEIIHPDEHIDEVILPPKQKELLLQIIAEQKNSEVLLQQGIAPTNRLLLCGPPGCGKTMTAMSLARELQSPMAYVRLDGLVSSFLGQTSTNLRKVFDSVRNQRIVLFLDEFDAIAKKRDDANELGELKRVVTTLLQNFDNLPEHVFLIAATNHQHLLDPAIWRRFNVTIMLNLPDNEERLTLIKKWLNEYPSSYEIDIAFITKLTEGMNGSQIKDLIKNATKYQLVTTGKADLNHDALIDTFVRQATLYSNSHSEEFWSLVKQFRQRGVSFRTLEKALGIPKSTIRDKIIMKEDIANE